MPICRAGRIVAEDETRRTARLLVDLPGPKLRTGSLAAQTTSDRKGHYLRLRIGDRLLLTRADDVAGPEQGEGLPAQIGCSLPEAFAATRRGHHVWLDDGKLGGVVEAVDRDSIELRITSAGPKGAKLRAGKGINLPDATLEIDLLGSQAPMLCASLPNARTSSGCRLLAVRARCSESTSISINMAGQRSG